MIQISNLNFSKIKLGHMSLDLRIMQRSIELFHIQNVIFS